MLARDGLLYAPVPLLLLSSHDEVYSVNYRAMDILKLPYTDYRGSSLGSVLHLASSEKCYDLEAELAEMDGFSQDRLIEVLLGLPDHPDGALIHPGHFILHVSAWTSDGADRRFTIAISPKLAPSSASQGAQRRSQLYKRIKIPSAYNWKRVPIHVQDHLPDLHYDTFSFSADAIPQIT